MLGRAHVIMSDQYFIFFMLLAMLRFVTSTRLLPELNAPWSDGESDFTSKSGPRLCEGMTFSPWARTVVRNGKEDRMEVSR